MDESTQRKRKKTDTEALNSGLMRIPGMKVAVARDLIDIGIREIYELRGRSPEVLWEEARGQKPDLPQDRLAWFRLAVYVAETDQPERHLLHPRAWA
ncbi:MAG: helix-hairpin-helix domain-containing protein [Opitutales bacterium]